MTDPGPRSVRRNICLYAALVSPCAVFFLPPFLSFLFLGLSLLSTFLHLFSSYLFHPVTGADSPTAAPISPVEANYWSQVVEGLKRSFFQFFFLFFITTTTTHLPQARTLDAHQVWQCHRGAVCGDKIWTEVLLGKAFYQPGLACARANEKPSRYLHPLV